MHLTHINGSQALRVNKKKEFNYGFLELWKS